MPGLAEAIVMGSKLYKAGKQVKNSVQSVGRGMQTFEKKKQMEQKKQAQAQKKMQQAAKPKPVAQPIPVAKPKPVAQPKPVAKPAPAKPVKTAPAKKPNLTVKKK